EEDQEQNDSWLARLGKQGRWQPWGESSYASMAEAAGSVEDNKEGGTGTRAKGEDGSMGNETAMSNKRYAVQGPKDDAEEFGMIGLLNKGAGGGGRPEPMDERTLEARAAPPADAQEAKGVPSAGAMTASRKPKSA